MNAMTLLREGTEAAAEEGKRPSTASEERRW